jgi:hypothetical protein
MFIGPPSPIPEICDMAEIQVVWHSQQLLLRLQLAKEAFSYFNLYIKNVFSPVFRTTLKTHRIAFSANPFSVPAST